MKNLVLKALIGIGIVSIIAKNEIQIKKEQPKVFFRKKIAGNFNALALPPFGIYISEKENE